MVGCRIWARFVGSWNEEPVICFEESGASVCAKLAHQRLPNLLDVPIVLLCLKHGHVLADSVATIETGVAR